VFEYYGLSFLYQMGKKLNFLYLFPESRNNSVMRLATNWTDEEVELDSQQGQDIFLIFIASKEVQEYIQSPIKLVLDLIPQGKNCREVKLTIDIHLVLKLTIMGLSRPSLTSPRRDAQLVKRRKNFMFSFIFHLLFYHRPINSFTTRIGIRWWQRRGL
jgi:hypothetical protein